MARQTDQCLRATLCLLGRRFRPVRVHGRPEERGADLGRRGHDGEHGDEERFAAALVHGDAVRDRRAHDEVAQHLGPFGLQALFPRVAGRRRDEAVRRERADDAETGEHGHGESELHLEVAVAEADDEQNDDGDDREHKCHAAEGRRRELHGSSLATTTKYWLFMPFGRVAVRFFSAVVLASELTENADFVKCRWCGTIAP